MPCTHRAPGGLWEAALTWASSHDGEKNAGVMRPASRLPQRGEPGRRRLSAGPECGTWVPFLQAHWQRSWAECLMTCWIKSGREKRTKDLFISPTAHKWAAAGTSRPGLLLTTGMFTKTKTQKTFVTWNKILFNRNKRFIWDFIFIINALISASC